MIEKDVRYREGTISKQEAVGLIRKCMEIALYRDCVSDPEFDLVSVEPKEGMPKNYLLQLFMRFRCGLHGGQGNRKLGICGV